jgi:hypothetical protein
MRLDTPEKRMAARWIPPNSRAVPHPRGEAVAVVYVSESANGKAYAVSYIGTAAHRAHNYSFRDVANRDKWIAEFFAGIDSHEQRKVAYREERAKPHDLKAGDIITNSWGYDQTNVDWYRVTKATANFVWLQPIAASLTEDDDSCAPMSGHTVPQVDGHVGRRSREVGIQRSGGARPEAQSLCGPAWLVGVLQVRLGQQVGRPSHVHQLVRVKEKRWKTLRQSYPYPRAGSGHRGSGFLSRAHVQLCLPLRR